MNFDKLKDDEKYTWTAHVKHKLMQYQLSPQRVKRIINAPIRTETDVIPGTIMSMQNYGSKKNPKEIWVLYVASKTKPKSDSKLDQLLVKPKVKIISAWRYPGVSPKRNSLQIPEEVLMELSEEDLQSSLQAEDYSV